MHEIGRWILEAAGSLGIVCRRVPGREAEQIVCMARSHFVDGNPRSWWLSPKLPFQQFSSERFSLIEILPSKSGPCWLVPETETAALPVFEVAADKVESILAGSSYFEYYLLAHDLSWLLIESDHNIYYVCQRKCVEES